MGSRRLSIALSVLCVLSAVVGVAGARGAVSPSSDPAVGVGSESPSVGPAVDATRAPPDPEEDVLGWENGVWHNESIAVTPVDGFNRSETRRLLNRTMARVEYVRHLEFESDVDLQFRTHEAFSEWVRSSFDDRYEDPAARTALNVQYEAMGFVGERTSAVRVLEAKESGYPVAFVPFRGIPDLSVHAGDVVFLTDDRDDGTVLFRETVLGHELVHALQLREFDTGSRSPSSVDASHAFSGLLEGDANYVTYRYDRRCGDEWECVLPRRQGSGAPEGPVAALTFFDLSQYGNGPGLVKRLYDEGGWAAVDAAYGSPPTTTEQVIHPRKYPGDRPRNLSVADTSGEDWRPVSVPGRPDHVTVGETGLYTMLWYPSFEDRGAGAIPYTDVFNSSVPSPHRYDYDHPYSAGWDGDRLVPYVSAEAVTNETAYVWKIAWDTPADAREFLEGYRKLLDHHDARRVTGHANTYRIPEDDPFGDAVSLERNGSTVVVVNAPTVEDLPAVRAGAAPTVETTPTGTVTPTRTETLTETQVRTRTATADPGPTPTRTDGSATTTGGGSPGFGATVAVLALVAALLVLAGRRR